MLSVYPTKLAIKVFLVFTDTWVSPSSLLLIFSPIKEKALRFYRWWRSDRMTKCRRKTSESSRTWKSRGQIWLFFHTEFLTSVPPHCPHDGTCSITWSLSSALLVYRRSGNCDNLGSSTPYKDLPYSPQQPTLPHIPLSLSWSTSLSPLI